MKWLDEPTREVRAVVDDRTRFDAYVPRDDVRREPRPPWLWWRRPLATVSCAASGLWLAAQLVPVVGYVPSVIVGALAVALAGQAVQRWTL